jgi:hypothetical protein
LLAPIAAALGESCLPAPLRRLVDGSVRCQLNETLALGARCNQVEGRELERVLEDGREVCRVAQLVPTREERALQEAPPGVGWFYDDFTLRALTQCPSARPQLLNFANTEPTPDAELRIECVFDDTGDPDTPQLGRSCDPEAAPELPNPCQGSALPLYCEPSTRLCELRCNTSADCPLGFTCTANADPTSPDPERESGYCTDPRCR